MHEWSVGTPILAFGGLVVIVGQREADVDLKSGGTGIFQLYRSFTWKIGSYLGCSSAQLSSLQAKIQQSITMAEVFAKEVVSYPQYDLPRDLEGGWMT